VSSCTVSQRKPYFSARRGIRLLHRTTSAIMREMPRSRHRAIRLPSSIVPSPWPLRSEYQQRRLGSVPHRAVRTRHRKDRCIVSAASALEDCGHGHPLCRIDAHQLVEKSRRDAAERGKKAHLQIGRGDLRQQGFDPRGSVATI
jgi:hypothetical protein